MKGFVTIRCDLDRHPNVSMLAERFGMSVEQVIGHLYRMWNGFAKYAREDGTISCADDLAAFEVSFGATEEFWEAVAETEWIVFQNGRAVIRGTPTSNRKKANGQIYFVLARKANLLKIGFTARQVSTRIDELQTTCGERLELLGSIPGTEIEEDNLHFRFRDQRTYGEWFSFDGELVDFVDSCCGEKA